MLLAIYYLGTGSHFSDELLRQASVLEFLQNPSLSNEAIGKLSRDKVLKGYPFLIFENNKIYGIR